ncbi:MAG: NADH-quinone oxidoreductase subunit F, partial [Syntrophobacteraceae bacterium]|nr:NADH-quinone oxidoreductase subunit F [Syntrophobacteraceae bacterium]
MKTDQEPLAARFARLEDECRKRVQAKTSSPVPVISIGMATCGLAAGAQETKTAFEDILREKGFVASIENVGCLGHCYAEPLVIIENPGFPPIAYHEVTPGKARALVRAFLEEGDPLFEYMLGAMEENDLIPAVIDFQRFQLEKRVVMEFSGTIDPSDLEAYIAAGGYGALAKALDLPPDEVTRLVLESGLRGRGGAGFPTGLKWQCARSSHQEERIVICNADEGDPGAYMDRTILESNPHQVLEGLAICAYAVGASRAIIYVRAEYPLAVSMMSQAIAQAKKLGILGDSVLGSPFQLEATVFQGSGAFVCGEETALIQSLQGRRGMPQHRPPYPVQSGLWGKPTVINNVKTLASVPPIVTRGPDWYRSIGSVRSPGTAIFSVVGKVIHPGLVEIPMGTKLREIIYDIGGGIPNGRKFKAVQTGGPSGGCITEAHLDTPIDYDNLIALGSMMGSGGMIVMDEDNCMVDIARFFLDFTVDESCGKCTPCREGT